MTLDELNKYTDLVIRAAAFEASLQAIGNIEWIGSESFEAMKSAQKIARNALRSYDPKATI
jgi:hypothetical protein